MKSSSPLRPSHNQSRVSPSSTPPRSHHAFSETMIEENLDQAESIITKWDIDSHVQHNFSSLFTGEKNEATRFLQSVTGLKEAMHHYLKLTPNSAQLVRAQNLMQIAMKRLEKEFYVVLCSNRNTSNSESISGHFSRVSIKADDGVPGEEEVCVTSPQASDIAMTELKSIATCMIESGYSKECLHIYKLVRKSIIDETLYYLGIQKLSFSQMQKMEWGVLEQKIKTWLYGFKIAVKTLFHGERILCDTVFASSENIVELCFTEISREAAINLFSFPENFAKSKKILSPDKMFRTLDLHDAISEFWPKIETIFSYESLSAVRSEAVAAQLKLGEAVRTMLSQFEDAIQKDSSKTPVTGGGIHPLTRYVMNFLVFLGDYSGALSDILADSPVNVQQISLPESYFSSPTSGSAANPSAAAITNRLAWLILVLLCKLDGKAVLYNDVALSYFFLANNLNYVVSKVRNSCLGILMGPEWIWKHRSKVRQYVAKYESMGWSEVVSSLPDDPTGEISPGEVNLCFKKFNFNFEMAYKKQSSWVIPDPELRDEVKVTLSKNIVLSYHAFYQNHREYARGGGGVESNVRFAPEDLNNYLSDLFFAAVGGSSRVSSSESSIQSRAV